MIYGLQKYNEINYICQKETTLKEFLIEKGISSRMMVKLKREKGIFVNGDLRRVAHDLNKGDRVRIVMNEEKNNFELQDIELEVLYEDYDLLIVNKQPFIVVHPTKSHPNGTIANSVANYLDKRGENIKIRFINRLDMNTSGLLIIGKNPFSQHVLSKDMSENLIDKEYLTLVHGSLEEDEGTIDKPIYRPTDDSIKRVVDERGQRSITHYKVVKRLKGATLVKIKLETGRTHQIRVHMSDMGHPIVGDELYGSADEEIIKRQALHAYKLNLSQPRTKERLSIESGLPSDIKDAIGYFEGK